MPIVRFIKNEKQNISAMKGSIDYCLQKHKTVDAQTGKRYVSGVNCNGLNAFKEFMTTKLANDAIDGRLFYQYVQSFSPKDNVDYDKAHEIALVFAEKAWQGHEVLVTTHCDRNHVHTHFIINSVSFETGKKLRQNPNTLLSLRKLSDEICQVHGITTLKPYTRQKEKRPLDGEYRAVIKGESWKFALMYVIDNAMKRSGNKKGFIDEMEKHGYKVLWTDERKYITYTCPNGMKCRDIKLHQERYRKEKMDLEFELRRIETEKRTARSYGNRFDFDHGESDFGNDGGERLLESVDRNEQKSESSARYDIAGDGKQRADSGVGGSDKVSVSQDRFVRENDNADANGAEKDSDRTGWEAEREVFLAGGEDRIFDNEYEKEAHSSADRDTDNYSTRIDDSIHFAGNLFKMINNQTRYHKKRIRLSQKEIEKRLAHGQKSEGYEEYEDYNDKNLTM